MVYKGFCDSPEHHVFLRFYKGLGESGPQNDSLFSQNITFSAGFIRVLGQFEQNLVDLAVLDILSAFPGG